MNSPNESNKLLPYVSEIQDTTPRPNGVFARNLKKNGLATAAFIVAISSLFLGFLLVPSVLGVALGVGALVIAVKRKISKKLSIYAIIISSLTLVVSLLGWTNVAFFASSAPDPYVPPSYTYDAYSGIAYKYNPATNIGCNGEGECAYEVKLFVAVPERCDEGGSFTPNLKDLGTDEIAVSGDYPFPALAEGETHTISAISYNYANSRLIEDNSGVPPIVCK